MSRIHSTERSRQKPRVLRATDRGLITFSPSARHRANGGRSAAFSEPAGFVYGLARSPRGVSRVIHRADQAYRPVPPADSSPGGGLEPLTLTTATSPSCCPRIPEP